MATSFTGTTWRFNNTVQVPNFRDSGTEPSIITVMFRSSAGGSYVNYQSMKFDPVNEIIYFKAATQTAAWVEVYSTANGWLNGYVPEATFYNEPTGVSDNRFITWMSQNATMTSGGYTYLASISHCSASGMLPGWLTDTGVEFTYTADNGYTFTTSSVVAGTNCELVGTPVVETQGSVNYIRFTMKGTGNNATFSVSPTEGVPYIVHLTNCTADSENPTSISNIIGQDFSFIANNGYKFDINDTTNIKLYPVNYFNDDYTLSVSSNNTILTFANLKSLSGIGGGEIYCYAHYGTYYITYSSAFSANNIVSSNSASSISVNDTFGTLLSVDTTLSEYYRYEVDYNSIQVLLGNTDITQYCTINAHANGSVSLSFVINNIVQVVGETSNQITINANKTFKTNNVVVNTNLTNCTSTTSSTTIARGETKTIVCTAQSGFRFTSDSGLYNLFFKVNPVGSATLNVVSVSNDRKTAVLVLSDVTYLADPITVQAIASATTFDIIKDFGNDAEYFNYVQTVPSTLPNSIQADSPLHATISIKSEYVSTKGFNTVKVENGGVDVTSSAYNSSTGAIDVNNANGDIKITIRVSDTGYTYTTNLTNCIARGSNPQYLTTNAQTFIFNADKGYYFVNPSTAITGTNCLIENPTYYGGSNTYLSTSITKSGGSASTQINVIASVQTYYITENKTNCTITRQDQSVLYNTYNVTQKYDAKVEATTGYSLSNVVVKLNNVDITSAVYTQATGRIYIDFSNTSYNLGDLVITASANVINVPITINGEHFEILSSDESVSVNANANISIKSATGYTINQDFAPQTSSIISCTGATATLTRTNDFEGTITVSTPTNFSSVVLDIVPVLHNFNVTTTITGGHSRYEGSSSVPASSNYTGQIVFDTGYTYNPSTFSIKVGNVEKSGEDGVWSYNSATNIGTITLSNVQGAIEITCAVVQKSAYVLTAPITANLSSVLTISCDVNEINEIEEVELYRNNDLLDTLPIDASGKAYYRFTFNEDSKIGNNNFKAKVIAKVSSTYSDSDYGNINNVIVRKLNYTIGENISYIQIIPYSDGDTTDTSIWSGRPQLTTNGAYYYITTAKTRINVVCVEGYKIGTCTFSPAEYIVSENWVNSNELLVSNSSQDFIGTVGLVAKVENESSATISLTHCKYNNAYSIQATIKVHETKDFTVVADSNYIFEEGQGKINVTCTNGTITYIVIDPTHLKLTLTKNSYGENNIFGTVSIANEKTYSVSTSGVSTSHITKSIPSTVLAQNTLTGTLTFESGYEPSGLTIHEGSSDITTQSGVWSYNATSGVGTITVSNVLGNIAIICNATQTVVSKLSNVSLAVNGNDLSMSATPSNEVGSFELYKNGTLLTTLDATEGGATYNISHSSASDVGERTYKVKALPTEESEYVASEFSSDANVWVRSLTTTFTSPKITSVKVCPYSSPQVVDWSQIEAITSGSVVYYINKEYVRVKIGCAEGYEIDTSAFTKGIGVDIGIAYEDDEALLITSNGTGANTVGLAVKQSETPEPPTPTVHSITYNLTNVASSSSITTVPTGNAYTTTLTLPTGDYQFDSIQITMEGSGNITQSVLSNNVITIPSVTGNVVITATAYAVTANEFNIQLNQSNDSNIKLYPKTKVQNIIDFDTQVKTINGQSLKGSGNIVVTAAADSALSTTSTNAIQNKVVALKFNTAVYFEEEE